MRILLAIFAAACLAGCTTTGTRVIDLTTQRPQPAPQAALSHTTHDFTR